MCLKAKEGNSITVGIHKLSNVENAREATNVEPSIS
jgi:hypothetical protein